MRPLRADQAEPPATHGSGEASRAASEAWGDRMPVRATANADPLSAASLLSGQPTAPAPSFSPDPPLMAAHAFTRGKPPGKRGARRGRADWAPRPVAGERPGSPGRGHPGPPG
jgi:hypothetical protein